MGQTESSGQKVLCEKNRGASADERPEGSCGRAKCEGLGKGEQAKMGLCLQT